MIPGQFYEDQSYAQPAERVAVRWAGRRVKVTAQGDGGYDRSTDAVIIGFQLGMCGMVVLASPYVSDCEETWTLARSDFRRVAETPSDGCFLLFVQAHRIIDPDGDGRPAHRCPYCRCGNTP